MVKQGSRDHPVLSRALEAFLLYMETGPTTTSTTTNPKPPSRSSFSKATSTATSTANANDTVNRPTQSVSSMLGKVMGNEESKKTSEQKATTSRKNADRLKQELAEQHDKANKSGSSIFSFPSIPGFADDSKGQKEEARPTATRTPTTTTGTTATTSPKQSPKQADTSTTETNGTQTTTAGRAEFQRPSNPKSSLIANGWIEQQRRSRFRSVWKEVLASLVEGRKKGEETTLWIQRQIVNPQTNQKELEALHQIPAKWLEEVTHFDYTADSRFSIKVFNLQEEFVFRCTKDPEASKKWVATLLAAKEGKKARRTTYNKSAQGKSTETEFSTNISRQSSPEPRVKTSHFSKAKSSRDHVDEAANKQQHQYPFDEEEKKIGDHQATNSPKQQDPPRSETTKAPRSIKELRAIAHGAGVQTAGMERTDLEAVVERIMASKEDQNSETFKRKQREEIERLRIEKDRLDHERRVNEEQQRRAAAAAAEQQQRQQAEETARLKREEMERQRQDEEAEATRRAAATAAAEEEDHRQRIAERVRLQQETERKRREEEERLRLEKERREREEEEHRRRVAEQQEKERQEQIRKQQEEYARQQKVWQEQQAEAVRLQRLKDEQEARRREEELRRRRQAEQWAQANPGAQQQHQQWHQHAQQQQQHAQQQQQPHAPPPHGYAQQQAAYQQQHYHHPGQQQQQQQHAPGHRTPPPQQQQQQHAGGAYYQQQPPPQQQQPQAHGAPPPPQQQPQPPQSPISQKYAKMAKSDSDDAASHRQIKHGLLVHWALQPPMLQALKPIEALITTVQTVFPPSFGVVGHDYFKKWKAVQFDDISTGAPHNRVDDDKLNKTVRKLRFFLHPDKLPNDLTADQSFLIKLLWDVTNDAFEEHKKKEEDLGWIRS